MLRLATKKQKHIIEYLGAKFTVKANTKEETQAIMDDNMFTRKIETDSGKNEYKEIPLWAGIQADNMDSQIIAWEGIEGEDESGKIVPLACNTENKRGLASLRENDHICDYIQTEINKIGKAKDKKDKKKPTT